MKIRTDFVTNSSSSSFICEKIATFTLLDKAGTGTDITFKKRQSGFDCDAGPFAEGKVYVPELFNEFLTAYYKDTQKIPTASSVFNSLLSGKKTPLVKSFIRSTNMESLSESILYFGIEKATVTSDMGSRLDNEWDAFLGNLNISFYGLGDYAEFIKAYAADKKYKFMVFHFEDWSGFDTSRFHDGYDENAEFVFGETKQHFAELNSFGSSHGNWEESKNEILAESSKKYLSSILSSCSLPENVIEAIENGDIKILFFAKDTGICDEIIWYSGKLTKENIKIHLFSEGEKVTDISDNTDEVNIIIKQAINISNKTVEPTDRKEICEKAEKEKREKVVESITTDVFIEQLLEEIKETGDKRLVTVLFADKKKYKYFCEFQVQEGDKVYVEGKRADELGVVIEISDKLPKGTAASFTLNVVRAFLGTHTNMLDSELVALIKHY